MYDFAISANQESLNVVANGYIWSNTHNNEFWPSAYNKPSFSVLPKQDDVKLNENEPNHLIINFPFNNYADKNYYNNNNNAFINNQSTFNEMSQQQQQQQQQNYYGTTASVLNHQFNNQKITENNLTNHQPSIFKGENINNDSNNSSGTSHLEHVSDDSPSNDLDKISNNNSYDSSSNKENTSNNNDEACQMSTNITSTNVPAYFTTQKMINNTIKLSYTAYQLELLNAIYTEMKYPNSVQKTLVAKLIGITRDQVKIWFQNRRRKDTLVSQGKVIAHPTESNNNNNKKRRRSDDDESENNEDVFPSSPETGTGKKKQVVENNVIYSVLSELRAHQNAPSRLSSKRTKPNSIKNEPQTNEFISITKNETNMNMFPVVKPALIESTNKLTNNQLSSYSSSASSSSSSEEENSSTLAAATASVPPPTAASIYMPNKYQALQQPFSIQEYIDNRCMSNYYKQPKIHNPQSYQINQSYSNPVSTSTNTNIKLNSWAIPTTQQHLTYQQNHQMNDSYSKTNYEHTNTENIYAINQTKYSAASQFNSNNNYETTYHQATKYPLVASQPDTFSQHVTQQNYQFLSNNLNSYNFCV